MASSTLSTRVVLQTPSTVTGMWAQRSSIHLPLLGSMSFLPHLMPLQRLAMSPMGTMSMCLPAQYDLSHSSSSSGMDWSVQIMSMVASMSPSGAMAVLRLWPTPDGSTLPPIMGGHASMPFSRHHLVARATCRAAEPVLSAYMKMAALGVRNSATSESAASSVDSGSPSEPGPRPSRARSLSLASRLLSSSLSLLMSSGSRPSPFLICL